MIRKLRRKFIVVIMSVVTVLIASAFIAILTTTSASLSRQTDFALRSAVLRENAPGPDFMPDGRRIPTITVVLYENGDIAYIVNHIYNVGDADIKAITARAVDGGKSEGVLREYSLRYLIDRHPDGNTVLGFVDISMEKAVIGGLLADSALIGGATLLLFFGVSILLSRWAVRPVEQAWNSQRQFVADASHELKTPLTVVLSNIEMLSDDDTLQEGKTRTRLENILEEARRMRALVDDLLSLARTDMTGGDKHMERVDMSALAKNAVLIFEPVFFDAGMRLEEQIGGGLFVRGDKARLCQLVEILLDNAAKYTSAGGCAAVRLTPAGKSEILLEVSNDSETIPKAALEQIFSRFYRLDKARSGGGYGLGLAIADGIVREHGGSIKAASENGRTAFTVTLPAAR